MNRTPEKKEEPIELMVNRQCNEVTLLLLEDHVFYLFPVILDNWEDFPNVGYIAMHEMSLLIYSGMAEEDVTAVIEATNGYRVYNLQKIYRFV